ncbi:MAG: thioredoxin family protein [Hydrogenobacter thermophilus]|uniref:Thioredoxin domain protein n=1 Tax=Hydrogenobacter thermophilus (strain DSM 6534 / IAM 12695 / TK-6) TaxID=608538 RepID=D3DJA6_HYDTT|nr:thioredoxin family protein [Hydrogenobacter thermophilus]ADO45831.1 thioredoxin domain protein [Hydrogenobacter thermophilus TK-6]MCS7285420.1 thioredoxin family protein [Hydrogenobacter thermophilus]BAI69908.1 thioredoxin domain protein [Hydrogenobacter thermophilus TK-6]
MEWLYKFLFLLALSFLVFVFIFRLVVIKRAKAMRGKRVRFIEEGFLYFYSERCTACKAMKPQIEKLKEKVPVKEVDVFSPEGSLLARELGIMATPTTLYVKDGIIQKAFVGVVKCDRLLSESLEEGG